MGMFEKLRLSETTAAAVEWDITPDLAFCTFSAKGLRGGLAKTGERVCYFFIDNWGSVPRLYLMERGARYVNILAEVKAPPAMLAECLVNQGAGLAAKGNFPIDAALKAWLRTEVVEPEESPFLMPSVPETEAADDPDTSSLPPVGQGGNRARVVLPAVAASFPDDQLAPLFHQWNFFDARRNPQGGFANHLADPGDGLSVVDERTGLMWQKGGLELGSLNSGKRRIAQLNEAGFADHQDWRLPTLAEAMSLLEAGPNAKGQHLHPCFSREQPFVFTADRRKPTGYWLVDYARGLAYWSSGTVPGGFCRLCRSLG